MLVSLVTLYMYIVNYNLSSSKVNSLSVAEKGKKKIKDIFNSIRFLIQTVRSVNYLDLYILLLNSELTYYLNNSDFGTHIFRIYKIVGAQRRSVRL